MGSVSLVLCVETAKAVNRGLTALLLSEKPVHLDIFHIASWWVVAAMTVNLLSLVCNYTTISLMYDTTARCLGRRWKAINYSGAPLK